MLIDCATCVARDLACGGCVVRVLLDGPGALASPNSGVDLDAAEQAAIGLLAAAGLVPPLRLVRPLGPLAGRQLGPDSAAQNGRQIGPGGISPGSAGSASRGIA